MTLAIEKYLNMTRLHNGKGTFIYKQYELERQVFILRGLYTSTIRIAELFSLFSQHTLMRKHYEGSIKTNSHRSNLNVIKELQWHKLKETTKSSSHSVHTVCT